MPELPEVEIMTRNAQQWGCGKTLVRAERVDAALLAQDIPLGGALGVPWRRGKYLCQPIDGAGVLVLHFRMTGKLIREVETGALRPHARLRLWLSDGSVLSFVDTRRLGCAWRLPDAAAVERLLSVEVGLGPEPWPEARDGAWWAARLGDLRTALKPALMRQERVAGLGNIAAAEICWRAGLDPQRPASGLTGAEWDAVAAAVPAFVAHVLAEESGPEIAYINEGRGADAATPFAVYARAGQRCGRCAVGVVRRGVQAGRATFWCPACQR